MCVCECVCVVGQVCILSDWFDAHVLGHAASAILSRHFPVEAEAVCLSKCSFSSIMAM